MFQYITWIRNCTTFLWRWFNQECVNQSKPLWNHSWAKPPPTGASPAATTSTSQKLLSLFTLPRSHLLVHTLWHIKLWEIHSNYILFLYCIFEVNVVAACTLVCKKAVLKCREKSTRIKDFSSLHITEPCLHGNTSVTFAPDIQEVLARQ